MAIFSWLLPVAILWQQSALVYQRMSNGAEIVAYVCPQVPYSVASLFVKTGSAFDPPNREGTAHLLEHLLPIQPHDGTTLQIFIERQGALLVPETGRDFMAFHLKTLNQNFEQVLPFLSQLAGDLKVDLQVVEREKRLMWLETLALYENSLWLMKTILESKLFDGTSYAHPPTGWLETIESLSLDDAIQFHKKHFFAPNMAFIAVVCEEKALAALRQSAQRLPMVSKVSAESASLSARDVLSQLEELLRRRLIRFRDAFWGIGWRIKFEPKISHFAAETLWCRSWFPLS
ncbi:MAG: insulinase family protein [Armatimonadota bacterium]|nr:insulinase family protein [Armatimonadota bacterium]